MTLNLTVKCSGWSFLPLGGKVNFVTFYHPPSSSIEDLQHFIASVSTTTTSRLPLILCGDFNIPNIDWDLGAPTKSSIAATTLCDFTQDHSDSIGVPSNSWQSYFRSVDD